MEKCAAAGRHNRMPDTLPQPLFAPAIPNFSLKPVIWWTAFPLPFTLLMHVVHTVPHIPLRRVSGEASKESCDHDSALQGEENRMMVETSGGAGQDASVGRRVNQASAHAHTHTYEAKARMLLECLECRWPHKGEKQKGEKREVGRCEWPWSRTAAAGKGLLVQSLEFNSVNLEHKRKHKRDQWQLTGWACLWVQFWDKNVVPSSGHRENCSLLVFTVVSPTHSDCRCSCVIHSFINSFILCIHLFFILGLRGLLKPIAAMQVFNVLRGEKIQRLSTVQMPFIIFIYETDKSALI